MIRLLLATRPQDADLVHDELALHGTKADVAAEAQAQLVGLHVQRAEEPEPVPGHLPLAVAPQLELPPPAELQVVPLALGPVTREVAVAHELPGGVHDGHVGVARVE